MVKVRAFYDDNADIPAWFDVFPIRSDDTSTLDRFSKPNQRTKTLYDSP